MSRVSVIIPTYNRIRYLEETVNSVRNLVHEDIELIVIDQSHEEFASKIQVISKDAKYYRLPQPGLASARNFGLKKASGDYVLFLDSDDLVFPDKLKIQLSKMKSHDTPIVCYSRWRFTKASGSAIRDDGENLDPYIIQILLYTNIAPFNAFLFDLEVLRAVDGFDENLEASEDWDLLIRIALKGVVFRFVKEVTVTYRLHEDSMSKDKEMMFRSNLFIIEKTYSNPAIPDQYQFLRVPAIMLQFADAISGISPEMRNPSFVGAIKDLWIELAPTITINRANPNPELNNCLKRLYEALQKFNNIEVASEAKALRQLLLNWLRSRN